MVAATRRFARAVLADRLLGDELTRLALAKVELDPKADPDNPAHAIRAFVRAWRLAASSSQAAKLFSDRALLNALPPPPDDARFVLILVDALDYSTAEAAAILAPLIRPAEELLREGRELVSAPRNASAIVIEDEPLIAAQLGETLEAMNVAVAGYARSARDAVALAEKTRPDIVLADYNLEGDETGAQAVARIRQLQHCPVVFITGFPDEVSRGDEVEPDFIIGKPFRVEAVQAAVAHCLDAAAPPLSD